MRINKSTKIQSYGDDANWLVFSRLSREIYYLNEKQEEIM